MRTRSLQRIGALIVAGVVGSGLFAMPAVAGAQPEPGLDAGTVRVMGIAVVLENPRGDAVVVGRVQPGEILEVLDRQGDWFLVAAPVGSQAWRRGWLHVLYTDQVAAEPDRPAIELGTSVRGFAQVGYHYFTASDSFKAVVGDPHGVPYGGGGQVGLGSFFAQASIERYQRDGERVFVHEGEIFGLGVPTTITVTPVLVSAGYRQVAGPAVGYFGGGIGWYRYQEESDGLVADESVDDRHLGYHVMFGFEAPVIPWLWLGGELQWATVPDGLGEGGVSELLDETDLGGFTVRFKVSFGL